LYVEWRNRLCDMQYVCHYVREYIFVWRETLILWLTDGVASKGVHTTMHAYRNYTMAGGRILLLSCLATEILQREQCTHILHMY